MTNIALLVASTTGADKPRTPKNPDLVALSIELHGFTEQQLDRPTSDDRNKLMANRRKIKSFDRSTLDESDVMDLNYLYVESTRRANRQEDFYAQNGNKFSDGKEY